MAAMTANGTKDCARACVMANLCACKEALRRSEEGETLGRNRSSVWRRSSQRAKKKKKKVSRVTTSAIHFALDAA